MLTVIKRIVLLFLIVSFSILSCTNNRKLDDISKIIEYLPCIESITPIGIKYYTLNIYKTPEYLNDVFRYVINEEKECICYDNSFTVFSLYFQYTTDDKIELGIFPVSNVIKENLSYEVFGAFYFENHFFLIANNCVVDGFVFKTKYSIAKFIIKEENIEFPDFDDSRSEFVFLGHKNNPKWKLIHHFKCQIK